MQRLPTLIPCAPRTTIAEMEALHPGPIIACDFYISGIEGHQSVTGGYRYGRVLNVDHHAPTEEMRRQVSSTNLAIDLVRASGQATVDAMVVINHTDCDSVLSSAIITGLLEPLDRYGDAAIAADHTGDVNQIAELLQGLDKQRDLGLSLASLEQLESGKGLDAVAATAVAERERKRAAARKAVEEGLVSMHGSVAFGEISESIDGEFFPSLLPQAALIVLMSPRPDAKDRWNTKIRLGHAAPTGASIHSLGIREVDPAFDGRWNAGSNNRSGGTDIPPDQYRERILELLDSLTSPTPARPHVLPL